MERPNDDLLDRWLRAEDEGSDAEAEAALTALFAALPPSAPPLGFAERVLIRANIAGLAGIAVPGRRRSPWRSRATALLPAFLDSPWGRASLVFGLVMAALGLPFLGSALSVLVGSLRPALLAPTLARVLTETSGWVITGLRLGRWLAAFARSLMTPLESPAVALAMGGCLLISALALRLLHGLIQRERNYSYANPL
jgi:hypothetical protein